MKPTLKGKLLDTLSTPPREGRLRGSLLRSVSEVEVQKEASVVDFIEIAEGAERYTIGPAEVLSQVAINRLVHISGNRLEEFREDMARKSDGKFGHGTYFALGNLSGETFDGLTASGSGNIAHEVRFNGSVLAVQRSRVIELREYLDQIAGKTPSKLRTTIQNAPLTDLLRDRLDVDAVLVAMEDGAAELVVQPAAVSHALEIVDTRAV